MSPLPNPWITQSALAPVMAADTAAAPDLADHPVAAAEHFESPSNERGVREAPVVAPPNTMTTGATDHIHEIFHHARKLLGDHHAKHNRFRLDIPAFMEAIEEMPLFLRAAE